MSILTTLVVLCLLSTLALGDRSDVGLNLPEMIENHGYVSETHTVTTDDGYILTLYRIPRGKEDTSTARRPPVFLVHGYLVCAGEFISLGPERSLSYILADAGYDVWLVNTRGTIPSRNHTTFDVNVNPELYFDYTWHEIGYYDIAKSVDYILEVNGENSLYYVGHSQGTTVFLVLVTTRPEYNSKIKIASLMAPAAIIKNYPNPIIQTLAKYVDEIWRLLKAYKIYEFPFLNELRETVTTLCADYPDNYTDPICDTVHDSLYPGIDKEDLPVVLSNDPSAVNLKQYMHFGQLVRDGGFRQYDHGVENNLEIYGTETPPDYDLSKITTPIAFYYAKNDGLIAVEDENTLVSFISNVVINYLVPDDSFAHTDFALNSLAVELVYPKLLSIMSNY